MAHVFLDAVRQSCVQSGSTFVLGAKTDGSVRELAETVVVDGDIVDYAVVEYAPTGDEVAREIGLGVVSVTSTVVTRSSVTWSTSGQLTPHLFGAGDLVLYVAASVDAIIAIIAASVTALAPLSSSLGANPVISFPSWPSNAPGALTNNGAGVLSWVPAGSGTVGDVPSIATEVLVAGEAVRFVTGGVQRAASNAPEQLEPVGFVVAGAAIGAPVLVRFVGVVDVAAALFDAAPTAAGVGKRVWLSTTAGRVTLTPPSAVGDVVQRVGIFATLAGGVGGSPQILVQIGDPVLL